MLDRSLADRVLGFWEERWIWEDDRWAHLALQAIAEATERQNQQLHTIVDAAWGLVRVDMEQQQRIEQLEGVVYRGRPCPPRTEER